MENLESGGAEYFLIIIQDHVGDLSEWIIEFSGADLELHVTLDFRNEPPHDKTNKMACMPSEDSDEPGHPPSLIRVFAVHMKKAWFLSYPLSAQRRL